MQFTVPQIFFNEYHVGGNDDLQKLNKEGKLNELIDKVLLEPISVDSPLVGLLYVFSSHLKNKSINKTKV